MYAAHYGHYNVIRLLLQHGANSSLQEPEGGKTALMLAASNGHTRCIETLVCQGGADIAQRDFSGNSASFYATHYGHGGNKIIARFLAIRQMSANQSSSHSSSSVLHSSTNTSGYKSASGQLTFGQHSPSSPFYVDNDCSNTNNQLTSPSSNRSNSRSPKLTPRAIFKSPSTYEQRRNSNGNCSSSSSFALIPCNLKNTLSPISNSASNAELNATNTSSSGFITAKSSTIGALDTNDFNFGQGSATNGQTSPGPFSPSQFLNGNADRQSPLCSTPQPNQMPISSFSLQTMECLSPTATSATPAALNTFSLHSSQSSNRPITNDVMIAQSDSDTRSQFDFAMDVDSFNTRRVTPLMNSSPLPDRRSNRPFESMNGSFHSPIGRTSNENKTESSSNETVSNDSPITSPANHFIIPSSADLPINVSAMLQNLRLSQYNCLFRDRRVNLLIFLQMSDLELNAIGVTDRAHIAQLLEEQTRIRQLLFGPTRDEVYRIRQQINILTGEQRTLQNTFRRLLEQMNRVREHLDQVDQQIAFLNKNTNELHSIV